MKYRHELKHEITTLELLTLRTRLKAVASPDRHTVGGRYVIDSLYFDTAADKALREKLNGYTGTPPAKPDGDTGGAPNGGNTASALSTSALILSAASALVLILGLLAALLYKRRK